MKTAVSLPDELFATADAYAARTRLSRSELYARALREYLDRHDQDRITAQIDALCADVDTRVPREIAAVVRRRLREAEW